MSSSLVTTMPVIDLNLQMKKVAIQGCTASSVLPFPCTTFNNGYASVNSNPPSIYGFIDTAVYMSIPVTITYTGSTTGGQNILNPGKDALRAYPLHSIIQTATCSINGFTVTLTPNPIIHPTSHYRSPNWSLAPHYTDKYQEYIDGYGAINNSLATYKDEIDTGKNESLPRGAFPQVVTNGTTSATITTTIVDALYIPPFGDVGGEDLGFSNISTMQWNFVYYNPLSRIVSHTPTSGIVITDISVALGQPTIYLKCYTPPETYIPRDISYPSQILTIMPTQSSIAMAPNASLTIDSSNMQFTNIPQHMFIFVKNADADMTYEKTDTYTAINSVSIRWNNTSGYLSSYSAYDLYTMSKENGLQDSWSEFKGLVTSPTDLTTQIGLCGSVIKVIFGKDLPFSSSQYIGMPGNFNFTIQINCTNVSQSSTILHPTLYCIPVYAAEFRIPVSGLPSQVVIAETIERDAQYIPYTDSLKYFGGDFKGQMKKINKWFKDNKVISSIASSLSGIPTIGPVASSIADIAKKSGYGLIGGAVSGGTTMTRAQLLDRIRNS